MGNIGICISIYLKEFVESKCQLTEKKIFRLNPMLRLNFIIYDFFWLLVNYNFILYKKKF